MVDDKEIWEIAKQYVDKQLKVIAKYSKFPKKMGSRKYQKIVANVVKVLKGGRTASRTTVVGTGG
jgi:hypothetical protein